MTIRLLASGQGCLLLLVTLSVLYGSVSAATARAAPPATTTSPPRECQSTP